MKSFLVSLSFLIFFIALSIVNCLYVTNVLSDVSAMLDKLPIVSESSVPKDVAVRAKDIPKLWDRHFRWLSLSINTAELRDCGTALGNLAQFSESDTSADYNATLSEAKTRIGVLYERERFSFFNIF